MTRPPTFAWLALLACLPDTHAVAQEHVDIESLDLESLLNQSVVSSTKVQQRGAQTPAVVTVVTAEEIHARGFRSLAEVLRAVPGFYDVDDLVSHNVGVRGINGGARAAGNVLKVMIDGHPVDYRSTTGNLLGPELIPLPVVERVEIIRGPASALYGANAFLGVVNVITKRGESLDGFRLLGEGALIGEHPGGGGGLLAGGRSGPIELAVAAHVLSLDRSGLTLPASSPILDNPGNPVGQRGASKDPARYVSVFARGAVGLPGERGRLTLLATVQHFEVGGEFQDFGPLTHGTRIALLNQNYRVGWELDPTDRLSIQLAAHYFSGNPTAGERLDIGRPDYILVRSAGVSGYGASAEVQVQAHAKLRLTFGADVVRENHLLQTFDRQLIENVVGPDGTVLRAAGTITQGEAHGDRRVFLNLGGFAQGLLTWNQDWSAVLGARFDQHDTYGFNPSARAGVVYAPAARPLSVKLLYGSSFKAPSAVQLYTQPMAFKDILGNPLLKAQTAHTGELAATVGLGELGEVSANVFATRVVGRVEFVQKGPFLEANNTLDEWVAGGELDARFKPARALQLRVSAGVARTVERSAGALLTGAAEVTNPLFPLYQLHTAGDYLLPWAGVRLSAELSYIGPRTTSQSNALVKGASYEAAGYLYGAAAVSTVVRLFGRETSASLRVGNLLNQQWSDPGFGGIDVPSQGPTAFLTVVQSI